MVTIGVQRRGHNIHRPSYMHARGVGERGGGVSSLGYVRVHLPLSSATPSVFMSEYCSSLDDFLPKVRDSCFFSLLTDDAPAIQFANRTSSRTLKEFPFRSFLVQLRLLGFHCPRRPLPSQVCLRKQFIFFLSINMVLDYGKGRGTRGMTSIG